MKKRLSIDRTLFFATALLVGFGYLIFSSASLGLLAREDISFGSIALKQALVGVVAGAIALIALSHVHYTLWRRYALYILGAALLLNGLIFIPSLAIEHGGATRWLALGPFSFQPSEVLKLATIIYYAAWIAAKKKSLDKITSGFLPLLCISVLVEGMLLLQHDTDPIIILALMSMFFVAGGKFRYLLSVAAIGLVGVALLITVRPYLLSRIFTFIDPSRDALGAGYQTQQALIAVGTGGIFGKGFGQSIQKFNFLPEPVGDSIFAVAGEEFGFIGTTALIALFLFFALRCFNIASHTKDPFGSSLVIGFTVLMIGQSFMNIGAMLGVLPLTGVPLLFVSQGGTAMLVGLAQVGIMLNISKYRG